MTKKVKNFTAKRINKNTLQSIAGGFFWNASLSDGLPYANGSSSLTKRNNYGNY